MQGQHRDPEYRKVNPNMKVPSIEIKDFKLFESHAILRYIADEYGTADHWYPKDPRKRAYINQILDWHHQNLRQGAEGYLLNRFINPFLTGQPCIPKKLEETVATLKGSLNLIENYWLKGIYLAGDQISIADLSLACELSSLHAIRSHAPEVKRFKELYPKTAAWHARIMTIPEVEEIHFGALALLEEIFDTIANHLSPKL